MSSVKFGRPSPALVIAVIALFVALSGSALALSRGEVKTRNLARGAVTAPKIKGKAVKAGKIARRGVKAGKIAPGAVRTPKIQDGAVTAAKLADGLAGPPGPAGPQGPPGPEGPPGSALAFATYRDNGDIVPAQSSGVEGITLTRESAGVYCFDQAPAGARTAVVSASGLGLDSDQSDRFAVVGLGTSPAPDFEGCSNDTDRVRVTTWDLDASMGSPTLIDTAFTIWFED